MTNSYIEDLTLVLILFNNSLSWGNEMKCKLCRLIYILCNMFNKLNDPGARILDSIHHIWHLRHVMEIAHFISTPKFLFSWSSLFAWYLISILALLHLFLSACLVPHSVGASINTYHLALEPVHTLRCIIEFHSSQFWPAAHMRFCLTSSSTPCRCLPHLGIFLCICHFAWVVFWMWKLQEFAILYAAL